MSKNTDDFDNGRFPYVYTIEVGDNKGHIVENILDDLVEQQGLASVVVRRFNDNDNSSTIGIALTREDDYRSLMLGLDNALYERNVSHHARMSQHAGVLNYLKGTKSFEGMSTDEISDKLFKHGLKVSKAEYDASSQHWASDTAKQLPAPEDNL